MNLFATAPYPSHDQFVKFICPVQSNTTSTTLSGLLMQIPSRLFSQILKGNLTR